MKVLVVLLRIGIVIIVLIVGFYVWGPKPRIEIVDRLCEFIRNEQKMECVAILANDMTMRPGAIVDFQATQGLPDRVAIPRADIFGPKCLVPGAEVSSLQKDLSKPHSIS